METGGIHQPDVSNDRANIRATVHVTALPVTDHITMVIGVPSHFVYILIKRIPLINRRGPRPCITHPFRDQAPQERIELMMTAR